MLFSTPVHGGTCRKTLDRVSSTRRDCSPGRARALVSADQLRDRAGACAAKGRYFRIPSPSGRRARLHVRAPRHARGL